MRPANGRLHPRARPLLLASALAICSRSSGQAASSGTPAQAAAALREGQAALSRHDLATAQAAFAKAVRLAPRSEPALAALGTVLLQQGDAAQAAHALQSAHALNHADLNATVNLALADQLLGQSARAVPLFAEAASAARSSRQPLPPPVRAAYARALAATGNLPQAATELQAAVDAEPNNATLHGDLGALYAQQKAWPKAEREFRSEVSLDPNAPLAHLRLGLAMQEQARAGALAELAEAARLAPQDDPVQYIAIQLALGKALAAAGDDAQAASIFEHVLTLQPGSTDATEQLAQIDQRANRIPQAIELFQKVLAADPDNPGALTNLGMAYAQQQRPKEAVPLLQRAVQLDPNNVTAHQDLAAAYVQLSQFADAATELRAALKLAPESPQLHYDLGLALKSQDDAASAIPELEQAQKLDASAPEAPYLLGVLYMQAGRYAEAARELQTSLRLRPANGDGWATLGSVLNKLDELPEAVNALREAIRQLPQQPDPHLTLAAVLTKLNQPAEAAAERKEAATLMRATMNRQRAEVATNAGRSLLKSGDLAGAAQQFHDALSFDPQYGDAHLGLADVLQAQGKPADAAAERRKANPQP